MSTWSPTTELAHVVDLAGFAYDPDRDIIYARHDALQRKFGYGFAYDEAAPAMSADIDCEPIFFDYGDKHWMIELWKGQYSIETGAEIGVYTRPIAADGHYTVLDEVVGRREHDPAHGQFFDCAADADMLTMSFTLWRDEKVLFTRGPERHWWLTGLRWGVFSDPRQLAMDVAIEFPNDVAQAAFVAALDAMDYSSFQDGLAVVFRFDTPRTYQPRLHSSLITTIDENNLELVRAYSSAELPSNDPNVVPGSVAVQLLGVLLRRTADSLGDWLSAALRKIGKTVADVIDIMVNGLKHVVDDVVQWIAQAGYALLEWLSAIGHWFEEVFTDFSSIVQVDNLFHGSTPPPTLRLVREATNCDARFTINPPKLIRPGTVARFSVVDNGEFLGPGSSGTVVYSFLDDSGQTRQVGLYFRCPRWSSNDVGVSDGRFARYAWSGEWSGPAWSATIPAIGHPLYVAYVWNNGPAPAA